MFDLDKVTSVMVAGVWIEVKKGTAEYDDDGQLMLEDKEVGQVGEVVAFEAAKSEGKRHVIVALNEIQALVVED